MQSVFDVFADIHFFESVWCAECIFRVERAHVFLWTCLLYAIKESALYFRVWLWSSRGIKVGRESPTEIDGGGGL